MPRPLSPTGTRDKRLAEAHRGIQSLARRPGQRDEGVAVYEIKVFEDVNVVVAGDGAFWWPIPEDLGEAEIVKVEAGISTVSSSGPVEIQLRHFTSDGTNDNGDILSTKISIDATEMNSRTAATQPVISGGSREVAHGDWLRIDVDAAGSGAKGLALMVSLTPSPLGSVTVAGSKGDPGGVTDWEGPWATSTSYQKGDVVHHNGVTYVARVDHTSSAASEPGIGASWQTYWMVLIQGLHTSGLVVVLDANGYPLDTGIKAYVHVPFAATIVEASLLANVVGSMVVDVWKDTYGNYPPTDADSITASAPLTLSSAIKTKDTSLTGWTKTLSADDVLAFNIDSVSVISKATVALKLERT